MAYARSLLVVGTLALTGCLFVDQKGDGVPQDNLPVYTGYGSYYVDCTGQCGLLAECQECAQTEAGDGCVAQTIKGACLSDYDCGEGLVCQDCACVDPTLHFPCDVDADCQDDYLWYVSYDTGCLEGICDPTDAACDYQDAAGCCAFRVRTTAGCCSSPSDCAPDEFCRDYACTTTCQDDPDCDGRCDDLGPCDTCACSWNGLCYATASGRYACCDSDADCWNGVCVDNACVPCHVDADCQGRCANLGECEACSCSDAACVPEWTLGCCEDDVDCDDGVPCDPDTHTCGVHEPTCADADDPDSACVAHCLDLEPCRRCSCDRTSKMCRAGAPAVGEACCLNDADCDDGDTQTLDRCPAPGAVCSHHPAP